MTVRAIRLPATIILTGLLVLSSANVAAADSGSVAVHHVYNTDGDGLYLHPDSPTIHSQLSDLMPEGGEFDITCWQLGDDVNGDSVWDYGTNPSTGHTGFAADFYLDTPVTQGNESAQLTALGIPQCGVLSTPAETTAAPVNIQLNNNSGTREHMIQDLAPRLQAAASAANIDGQLLARVIYHEGGNYLGSEARRDATEAAELATLPHSVGIAQMNVSTARLVALEIYQDWDVVTTNDDFDIYSRLIYDWDFSFRMAAGYLRLLQDAGMSGSWPTFMAYSLDPETALRWKATGHSMERSTLAALDMNVEPFIARQQHYNDAVDAIG
jgi:hypothetical protein